MKRLYSLLFSVAMTFSTLIPASINPIIAQEQEAPRIIEDGKIDDLIDAINDSNCTEIELAENGIYNVESTIEISRSVHINGNGATINYSNAESMEINPAFYFAEGSNGSLFENIKFNTQNSNSPILIFLSNSTQLSGATLDSCQFTASPATKNAMGIMLMSPSNLTIDKCNFGENLEGAVLAADYGSSSSEEGQIKISNSVFAASLKISLMISGLKHITVSDCIFENQTSQNSIIFRDDGGKTEDINFENNKMSKITIMWEKSDSFPIDELTLNENFWPGITSPSLIPSNDDDNCVLIYWPGGPFKSPDESFNYQEFLTQCKISPLSSYYYSSPVEINPDQPGTQQVNTLPLLNTQVSAILDGQGTILINNTESPAQINTGEQVNITVNPTVSGSTVEFTAQEIEPEKEPYSFPVEVNENTCTFTKPEYSVRVQATITEPDEPEPEPEPTPTPPSSNPNPRPPAINPSPSPKPEEPTPGPSNPTDTPSTGPATENDFKPDSGFNAGVSGTGPGFTEDGSTTSLNPDIKTQTTYTQNPDGSKAATTQNEDGQITSSVITIPDSAISNGQASLSFGENTIQEQSLAIPGNITNDQAAPELTLNLENQEQEIQVEVPIEAGTLSPGTTALLEVDGEYKPIPTTTFNEETSTLSFPLSSSAKLIILDNALSFADENLMPDYVKQAAAFTSARGLMTGMGIVLPKPFDFDGNTSRGQFATILWRLEDEPETSGAYPDGILAGTWDADPARWAVEKHLMAQGGSGFDSSKEITREQIIVILWRLQGKPQAKLSLLDKYSDARLISNEEFRQAMAWGVEKGIIGQGVDKLKPGETASRAEAAAMIERIVQSGL